MAGARQPAVQLLDEGGVACPASAVVPPGITPTEDPAFAKMQHKTGAAAKTLSAHPTARSEAERTKQAAEPPSNDVASQAKAAQVEEMAAAKPATFDKTAFVAAVRAAIEAKAPKNLDEADGYAKSGKVDAVKNEVKGKVADGKKSTEAPVKAKVDEPPDPSAGTPKPVTPMAPAPAVAQPGDPGVAAAMPKPAPPEQTNLRAGKCETDTALAEEGITERTLKDSNEPQFQEAAEAKAQGEEHSAQAPGQFRAEEQAKLGETKGVAAGAAQSTLTGMVGARKAANADVGGSKDSAKAKDEADRQRVSNEIEKIYDTAKADTNTILKDLDTKVDTEFEKGEKEARAAFEASYKRDFERWKDDRYGGISGAALWVRDKFADLPPEVNGLLVKAKDVYVKQMDVVVGRVADLVGKELGAARARVQRGKDEVRSFVSGLKGNLAKFGKEAENNVADKFSDLERSVDDKQEGMVDDLAGKYVEARNGLDERIKEIQAENKGLWSKAKALVDDVIETIKKLKDMLLTVLSRAANAIKKIIADPIGFLGKLVAAIGAGIELFTSKLMEHLRNGMMKWLFGELANAGIELPKKFDLAGIVGLVASILGISWANFRNRLVKKVGEPVAAKLEGALDFIKAIATEGPGAAVKWVMDKIGDLKETVMSQIREFVATKIVMAGLQWLVGLLNPAAAFIKACKMIYDLVMWIVDNAGQIKEFVDTVLGSVDEILSGGVSKVAGMINRALGDAIPLVIGVFASLLGLGDLGAKIKKILHAVQGPVNKVFDFLIGKAVKFGKGILRSLKRSKLGRAYRRGKILVKKGKNYVKKKVADTRRKLTRSPDTSATTKVKFDALSAATSHIKGLTNFTEIHHRLETIRREHRPHGLRSLVATSTESGSLVFTARASKPETASVRLQEVFPEASKELAQLRKILVGDGVHPTSGREGYVAAVLSVNGVEFGREFNERQRRDEAENSNHAEMRLLKAHWLRALEYVEARRASGEPTRVDLTISTSPCQLCAATLKKTLYRSRRVTEIKKRDPLVSFNVNSVRAYDTGNTTSEDAWRRHLELSTRDLDLSAMAQVGWNVNFIDMGGTKTRAMRDMEMAAERVRNRINSEGK